MRKVPPISQHLLIVGCQPKLSKPLVNISLSYADSQQEAEKKLKEIVSSSPVDYSLIYLVVSDRFPERIELLKAMNKTMQRIAVGQKVGAVLNCLLIEDEDMSPKKFVQITVDYLPYFIRAFFYQEVLVESLEELKAEVDRNFWQPLPFRRS